MDKFRSFQIVIQLVAFLTSMLLVSIAIAASRSTRSRNTVTEIPTKKERQQEAFLPATLSPPSRGMKAARGRAETQECWTTTAFVRP